MKKGDDGHLFEERKLLVCPAGCKEGSVQTHNNFTSCVVCEGLGLVDAETGEARPAPEITRQLLWKVKRLTSQVARLEKQNKELWHQIPEKQRIYPDKSRKD